MKKIVLSLVCLLFLPACISKHMAPGSSSESPVIATENEAAVVFLRRAMWGAEFESEVYDVSDSENKLIGIVTYGTKVIYKTTPGTKLFMVTSEAADFMKADLEAGKTYYAEILPRPGVFIKRFSLSPLSRQEIATEEFIEDNAKCEVIAPRPSAHEWAAKRNKSIQSKRDKYFEVWMDKDEIHRPYLKAEDGI